MAAARGGGPRRALLAAGTALAAGVALYLPFAVAAGPRRLFDELVGIAAGDGDLWRLPFPLAYDGPLRGWPPSALAEDLKDVLGFYLPLAALVLGAVVVVALLRRRPAAVAGARRRARAVLRLRALPALAARRPARAAAGRVPVRGDPARRRRAPQRALRGVLAAGLALIVLAGAANRLSALLLPPDLEPVHLAGVPGIRVPPAEAAALPRDGRARPARWSRRASRSTSRRGAATS